MSIESIFINHDLVIPEDNEKELVEWLYTKQSDDGRHHCENRLFVVVLYKNGEHWKLKSEILNAHKIINNYLDNFNLDNLVKLDLNGKEVLSDIIWISN
ncbi:hypothetical protein ACERCG_09300 [Mannheimia sp. E30BD]|uniref:hypothetical protein n=1 Tax=Mannheimia sp. E30BD TaxID=3278708 RepID=UPI00359EEDEF